MSLGGGGLGGEEACRCRQAQHACWAPANHFLIQPALLLIDIIIVFSNTSLPAASATPPASHTAHPNTLPPRPPTGAPRWVPTARRWRAHGICRGRMTWWPHAPPAPPAGRGKRVGRTGSWRVWGRGAGAKAERCGGGAKNTARQAISRVAPRQPSSNSTQRRKRHNSHQVAQPLVFLLERRYLAAARRLCRRCRLSAGAQHCGDLRNTHVGALVRGCVQAESSASRGRARGRREGAWHSAVHPCVVLSHLQALGRAGRRLRGCKYVP